MSLLNELQNQRTLFARCPHCDEEFRLSSADLFDATKAPLPTRAREHLDHEWAELRARRKNARARTRRATESCNIGKIVEKVASSLPGFPFRAGDCRVLLEPIDYVVFHGVSTRGCIEAVTFVDVKTGNGRLSRTQAQMSTILEAGRVSLSITKREG
jgi:predicted Holliday junction resolvase-like endonuclease